MRRPDTDDLTLLDCRRIVTWAVAAGALLTPAADGYLLVECPGSGSGRSATLPPDVTDACTRSGVALAALLASLEAATPLLAQVALWWELSAGARTKDDVPALREREAVRAAWSGVRFSAGLLAMGDVSFASAPPVAPDAAPEG